MVYKNRRQKKPGLSLCVSILYIYRIINNVIWALTLIIVIVTIYNVIIHFLTISICTTDHFNKPLPCLMTLLFLYYFINLHVDISVRKCYCNRLRLVQ